MILTDEAAEKKLILDMADRDIIDLETVRERFNLSNSIVDRNLKKELKDRGKNSPNKSGPFHNPHVEDEMKKTLLNSGVVMPGEMGLNVDVSDEEIKKRTKEMKKPVNKSGSISNKKFEQVPGRPKNITETKKREKKTSAMIWASGAQKTISDIYTPIVLEIYKKKNVRSLSVQETDALEEAKAKILMGLEPFKEINEDTILKSISINFNISELKEMWTETEKEIGTLTIDQKRQINSIFYSNRL